MSYIKQKILEAIEAGILDHVKRLKGLPMENDEQETSSYPSQEELDNALEAGAEAIEEEMAATPNEGTHTHAVVCDDCGVSAPLTDMPRWFNFPDRKYCPACCVKAKKNG